MSAEPQAIPLTVRVELGDDADDEAVFQAARQLRSEIADAGLGQAALTRGDHAPEGAKSLADALTPGAVTVQTPAAELPSLFRLLQDWLSRARPQSRRLRIARGEGASRVEVELDAAWLSEADLKALLDQLLQPPLGGVALQGEDVSVGQDVVGRDKITHIHAAPGSTVVVNPPPEPPPAPPL
jgi:hypothetical protein